MVLELPPIHYLWLGLFFGVVIGTIGWWWLKVAVGVISGIIVASEYHLFSSSSSSSSGVHIHTSGEVVITIIVAVIALLVGVSYGRLRGLRHLGQAELDTRWNNVKQISRW